MNHQTIDDIIARFGRAGWLVQKTKENYWTVSPKGLYNHKLYLLVHNPFDNKFQLVAPPTPHDPHYKCALKILEASDRQNRSVVDNLSIIKVKSMFPVRLNNLWINLALVRTLKVIPADDKNQLMVVVRWNSKEQDNFEGADAETLLAEWEKACDLVSRCR